MHVIGLTGEGLGLSPGATGIRREKTQFICKEEAPNRGGAKGDDAGQGRRETEEERENQAEEEVLGVGEPTQTLSPQDLCQEVGAEARCGGQGGNHLPCQPGPEPRPGVGRGAAGTLRQSLTPLIGFLRIALLPHTPAARQLH